MEVKKKFDEIEEAILNKLRTPSVFSKPARPLRPIAQPIGLDQVKEDLGRCEILVDTSPDRADKGLRVYRGIGRNIPDLMLEIGRLREETFRTVGEGTGLDRDLDRFDDYYDHFIAWDKGSECITGAYRIGRVDQILRDYGPQGIYTNTLFHLEALLETDFKSGTLEAGRSFVRPEYQRGPSLLVIWMGLGRFIVQNPEYKYLMGPVSISNEFQENSKHLMVSYLMQRFQHEKSELVSSKNPPRFESNLGPQDLSSLVNASLDLKCLQEFVRFAEGNPRAQIPQLIKLYLELGVRFLAFNKDEEFNTVDGLIWLDIPAVPETILLRYMGEPYKDYLARHRSY
jgi:putative hemolysin